jgi:hypothetical protein
MRAVVWAVRVVMIPMGAEQGAYHSDDIFDPHQV